MTPITPPLTLLTGPLQAMHCLTITGAHDGALTLAAGPLTWLNEYWRDIWVRSAPSSTNGQYTDDIGMWIWWFCVLWFVFLMALMGYFVAKYRRRKGKIAQRSAAHNTPLEIAWTVIPTLFLIYMFFQGFWSYFDKVVAPGNAVEMSVVAKKWNFSLTYPNGSETTYTTVIGAAEIPVFYMPSNVPIKLKMISLDVNHSFFVPDFRIKEDIMHNRYTTEWFEAKDPIGGHIHPKSQAEVIAATEEAKSKGLLYTGPTFVKEIAGAPYEDHWVFCAEYCGEQHSEMAAIIRVVKDDDFKKWLETIGINTKPLKEIGASVYKIKGCNQCHTIDGATSTGPTWKGMYGHAVEFTDGTSYTSEQMTDPVFYANYVRESIKTPAAKIVKGFGPNMPPQSLSEKQIDGVVSYLMSLSDVKPPPNPYTDAPTAPAEGAPAAPGAPAAAKPAAGAPATPTSTPTDKK
jgi:cytochrome c oxidase subunit 2